MLSHNNYCFSVFRSLEFAFLCLKMLKNASLRVKNYTLKSLCFKSLIIIKSLSSGACGGCEHSNCPSFPYGPVVKVQNKFHQANQINLAAIPCLYNNQHTVAQHYTCIPRLRQTQGKLCTYPVQDREVKSHTLFSSTSLFRPCKGVHPRLLGITFKQGNN